MYLPNPLTEKPQKVGIICDCKKAERQHWQDKNKRDEDEAARRRNMTNGLMSAKGQQAKFENISETPENAKIIQAAKRYCEQWQKNKENDKGLLFCGKPGRGKTTMAHCIANELLNRGARVKAITANSFIDLAYKNSIAVSDFAAADLIVLDDLGAEYKTKFSTSKVYELIDAVYNARKPLIITTNLTVAGLKEHLTGADGSPRAYDRLVEMLKIVEFTGENYRIKNASKKYGNFTPIDKG